MTRSRRPLTRSAIDKSQRNNPSYWAALAISAIRHGDDATADKALSRLRELGYDLRTIEPPSEPTAQTGGPSHA